MASRLAGEKCRRYYLLGVALGSTFRASSFNSLGTFGICTSFHVNTSQLAQRKLASSSSYLSPSSVPIMAVLEESPSCSWMVFMPMSFGGVTEDWLVFLVGGDSFRESSFTAVSTSLAVLGTRVVEAHLIALLSH